MTRGKKGAGLASPGAVSNQFVMAGPEVKPLAGIGRLAGRGDWWIEKRGETGYCHFLRGEAFRHRCGARTSNPVCGREVTGRFDSYTLPP